jgi:hypothetical protein
LRSRPCAGWPADAPATKPGERDALASFVETPGHGNDRGAGLPGEGSIRTDMRQWLLSPEEMSMWYIGTISIQFKYNMQIFSPSEPV